MTFILLMYASFSSLSASPLPITTNTRNSLNEELQRLLQVTAEDGVVKDLHVNISAVSTTHHSMPTTFYPSVQPDPLLHADLLVVLNAFNDTNTQMKDHNTDRKHLHRKLAAMQLLESVGGFTHTEAEDAHALVDLRHGHVEIIEWLIRHQPHLKELRDRVKKRGAYGLNLWPSHMQWHAVSHEGFRYSSRGLHHDFGAQFWPRLARAARNLEKRIQGGALEMDYMEYANYTRAQFPSEEEEHPEGIHISGRWTVDYVMSKNRCMSWKYPRLCAMLNMFVQDVCSDQDAEFTSIDLLPANTRDIDFPCHPRLTRARFATLHPGTVVVAHTTRTNQRLKIHCGVSNPSRVQMKIGNRFATSTGDDASEYETVTWEPRKCVMIDDSWEHSLSSSPKDQPRTILELAFTNPDAEHFGLLNKHGQRKHERRRREKTVQDVGAAFEHPVEL